MVHWKAGIFALAVMAATGPAWAGCYPNHKIDGSTAADARQKIEAAGYKQVRDLRKGCDNYWHGTARKDGAVVNIVLSPQGEVIVGGS